MRWRRTALQQRGVAVVRKDLMDELHGRADRDLTVASMDARRPPEARRGSHVLRAATRRRQPEGVSSVEPECVECG
ncbi:hypothetical protein [Kribbella sp. NPDC051137]|uniref:hypothetical protein n=1 Tax=Kribbella sp. NPDC051137 TaxID=3155045 RepID=UPI003435B60B